MQTRSQALTLGDTRGFNQVNEKIRKKHFFDTFPPIFTTDRPTDPIFQAKMTGNENIIDDRPSQESKYSQGKPTIARYRNYGISRICRIYVSLNYGITFC